MKHEDSDDLPQWYKKQWGLKSEEEKLRSACGVTSFSFVQHFCVCRDAWGPWGLPLALQGVWGGAGVQGAGQEPLEGGASPGGGCDCVVN